ALERVLGPARLVHLRHHGLQRVPLSAQFGHLGIVLALQRVITLLPVVDGLGLRLGPWLITQVQLLLNRLLAALAIYDGSIAIGSVRHVGHARLTREFIRAGGCAANRFGKIRLMRDGVGLRHWPLLPSRPSVGPSSPDSCADRRARRG